MKKIRTGIILFTLLQYFLYYGCTNGVDEIGKSMNNKYKIGFAQDTIYIKASIWGLTGDHMQIVFSPLPFESKNFDSSICFTYFEPTVYFKKVGDTLELYPTIKTDIPEGFSQKINIKQIVINKLEDIHRYKERYKEFGLNKISVYD